MRVLYLLIIAAANVLTAKFNPFVLFDGLVIVPVGSVLVGVVFILRDMVQMKHGKKDTYITIIAALLLSAVMSVILGDTTHVATASAISFLVSETIDTEIFTKARKSIIVRVLLSGLIGGAVDSAMFVIIGLSPIGSNVLTWMQVPFAIIGQASVKMIVQIVAVAITWAKLKKLQEAIQYQISNL